MITAFLMAALALVIGFIMGANAAKSKILHDIEMGFLDGEIVQGAIKHSIKANAQEPGNYPHTGRTVNGTFHRME